MTDQTTDIDLALARLRQAGHAVHVIGPFSNGHRLVEIDEVLRNHHEIVALAQALEADREKTEV